MGQIADGMRSKLEAEFAPHTLEIIDDSERHRGHAGAREGGESHFRVKVVSDAFEGMNAVERHRSVHAALADELAGPVHALQVKALTPNEAAEA